MQFLRRAWSLLRRRRFDLELEEEIRQHFDLKVQEYLDAGLSADHARRRAYADFGNPGLARERTRESRGLPSLESLAQDARFALRLLRRSPGFTAVAVLTLALGIGANTAIFSVVNTVLIQPLPYSHADRLVMLWQSYPAAGFDRLGASPPEYIDYRDRAGVFAGVAGYGDISFNLTGGRQPDRVKAARVTGNFFPVLGVSPLLGRTLTPDDDRTNGPQLAVISYGLWNREFNFDPDIIGRKIRLDGQLYSVIGVMPAAFWFSYDNTPRSQRAEIWVAMDFTQNELQARAVSYDVRVIARLKDGVSVKQARAGVERIANLLVAQYPEIYSGNVKLEATVSPLAADVVAKARAALLILLGAVGFVLLIACANVANLMLARATGRLREMAVRSALGASSGRLIRQVVIESVTLAFIGGALGLSLAILAVNLIAKFGPEQLPRIHEVRVEPAVLLFTAAVSLLTGVLFGLAPAWRAAHVNLNDSLKETGHSSGETRERHRARSVLVVVETACALVLLCGAGLLIRSFLHVIGISPGFNPESMLMVRTAFDNDRYPGPEQRRRTEREMLSAFERLPGVQSVGLSVTLPLRDDRGIGVRIEGRPANEFHHAKNDLVSNDYFQAMGIPLLQGRAFTDQDQPNTPLVAIVNRWLAQEYWQGDAVGKRFFWGGRLFTVVGIAGDVRLSGLDADPLPTIYMPTFQVNSGISFQAVFALRVAGAPEPFAAGARNVIWSSDKDLPVYDVAPMTAVIAESLAQRRFTMWLLGGFAAMALLMAGIGLYGVISYSVARRTRELGLRVALGARPRFVLGMVLKEGLRLVIAGVVAGLVAVALMARAMTSLLVGVSSYDPAALGAATVLLFAVALAAGYIPARRATRVDPMIALRHE